jgi:1-acyl-sn-glycerol-3-phosphate acyltransferase
MKKAGEYLLSGLAWLFGLTAFFLGALAMLLVGLFHTGPVFEWLIKLTCHGVLLATGVRVRVHGRENIKRDCQYILMMNHVNFFDPFVFYRGFPGKARGIEEESHFNWPLYGWVIRRIGQVPVNRTQPFKAMRSLDQAAAVIRRKHGFSFLILPEGTRTRDGRLGAFKKGGFHLAIGSGLDIVPIVQVGSFRINRRGSKLIRPGRIDYFIEKPIPLTGYSKDNIEELMTSVRNVFLQYVR